MSRAAYPADRRIRLGSGILFLLLVVQIALGYGSFVWTVLRAASETRSLERILITASHQTVGALILAFSMVMALASVSRAGWKKVS